MRCYDVSEFFANAITYAKQNDELAITVEKRNVRPNGSSGEYVYDLHYQCDTAHDLLEATQEQCLADNPREIETDLADAAQSLATRLQKALPDFTIDTLANKVTVSKDLK